eukprot:150160-Amphidinium_carterae.1
MCSAIEHWPLRLPLWHSGFSYSPKDVIVNAASNLTLTVLHLKNNRGSLITEVCYGVLSRGHNLSGYMISSTAESSPYQCHLVARPAVAMCAVLAQHPPPSDPPLNKVSCPHHALVQTNIVSSRTGSQNARSVFSTDLVACAPRKSSPALSPPICIEDGANLPTLTLETTTSIQSKGRAGHVRALSGNEVRDKAMR